MSPRLVIFTFDVDHFRATAHAREYWRLIVDDERLPEIAGD